MATVAELFLAVVFVGAAVGKAADADRFLRTLAALPWLSLPLARVAVRAIPAAEFLLGVGFLIAPAWAAAAALPVLVAFSAVVAIELVSGRQFDCGCFGGVDTRPANWRLFARNALLGGAAVAVIVAPATEELGAFLLGIGSGFAFLLLQVGGETLSLVRR